jgi:lipopolysaccharide O-acetyltransferase
MLFRVHRKIKYLIQAASHERPIAAGAYVLREVMNVLRARIAAWMVGWHRSSLEKDCKIVGSKGIFVGANTSIKRHAWIEAVFAYNGELFNPCIKIGQYFFASERLHISAIHKIEIGDNCLFGSGVYISDHNHGAYKGAEHSAPTERPISRKLVSFGSVVIGSNVWLGDNVVVIGPVTIGNGVVIGANSVVTRDIPDNVMAAGAPLRLLKIFNSTTGRWEKFK